MNKNNYVDSTPIYSNITCPEKIKNSHHILDGYYGILKVLKGYLYIVWDDKKAKIKILENKTIKIPPKTYHHLEFEGDAEFQVDFYKLNDENNQNIDSIVI